MNSQKNLTKLEAKLKNNDEGLFGQYANIVDITRDIMPRAYATFWQYTDHTLTHTHAVIQIIDRLCVSSFADTLSNDELFVLLAGGTLHDIGMITSTPLQGLDADEARLGHDVIGAEKVRQSPETYGVPPKYANAVATIIRHHRSSDINRDVQDEPVGFDLVRLRPLCALVRAGDELHLTDDRAPDVVLANLDLPDDSVKHFAHCKAVKGVALRSADSPKLMLQAVVKDRLAELV